MDFELDGDQRALQDAARALLDDHASSARVRAVIDNELPYDAELWKAMVDQGWPGIATPADRGGVGLGMVEAAILCEEVGAHVAPAPIVGQLVALAARPEAALLGGEAIACVASSGRREVVPYAPVGSSAILVNDDRLVAIELDDETRPRRERAMDVTRPVGWLDPAKLDGDDLGGPAALRRHVDTGAVLHAAELLGLSRRMLDVAVQYAKDRVQFGRPIGSFQAVKHRCADMLVDVEGMRSAVYWAAWCLSVDHPDASVAASTAKVWCSDAARRVIQSALQVHGGIGFTWDHDLHLYLKRAHLDGLCFGDSNVHRARLAALLRARLDAGESLL